MWQIALVRRGLLVLALLLTGTGTASAATQITLVLDPAVPTYGTNATFSGAVTPAAAGEQVDLLFDTGSGWTTLGSASTAADGTFAFSMPMTTPGSYEVETQGATSPALVVSLKPQITTFVSGLPYLGSTFSLGGRLTPATAGALTLTVGSRTWPVAVASDGRFRHALPTSQSGLFAAKLDLAPTAGFEAIQVIRNFRIRTPSLSLGSRGPAVLALERELAARHFVLRGVNRYYGFDTYEAVLAFQKVKRMARTGRVTATVWYRLSRSGIPHARIARGSHIEVDKTRQVLFEVRRGAVARVVHVSTGATGNTPVGRWRIYAKSPGLNGSGMYYSNYFLRGFAIHGYYSVPPYPASHGCVRTPMWFAPGFYSRWAVGATVYIFS
ncbi:MAG TPA: L,D-transpeptidase family protein [Gaiellaceae bacterium]